MIRLVFHVVRSLPFKSCNWRLLCVVHDGRRPARGAMGTSHSRCSRGRSDSVGRRCSRGRSRISPTGRRARGKPCLSCGVLERLRPRGRSAGARGPRLHQERGRQSLLHEGLIGDLWIWLQLMWLRFEVVRGPVGVDLGAIWGQFGPNPAPNQPHATQTGPRQPQIAAT